MSHIILPPRWRGDDRDVPARDVYDNRRTFIKKMGLGTIGLAASAPLLGCADSSQDASAGTAAGDSTRAAGPPSGPLDTIPADAPRAGYPAARNEAYTVDRPMTSRMLASSYNNFYEFKNQGDLKNVWPLTGDYDPFPWTIEIGGLVEEPFTLDLDQFLGEVDLEERYYRFRCVEAWAITVPWTGFPLRTLVERARPLSSAQYVRFISADRPEQMPGLKKATWYPWPYFEALRMDEATNELAFVATGVYGEPLPKQNGSPWRLALPWKYGYKGPKAFVRMEFVEEKPSTFWHDLEPSEYGFLSNVNPNIPHPRWSQASEKLLVDEDTERQIDTQLFNGYGEWVADLYPDEPRTLQQPMAR